MTIEPMSSGQATNVRIHDWSALIAAESADVEACSAGAGFARGGAETWIPVILGAGALVYSLLTDYELGVVRRIPMPVHLTLDLLSGLLLAVSPWLFGFSEFVWVPHLLLGLVEVGAHVLGILAVIDREQGGPEAISAAEPGTTSVTTRWPSRITVQRMGRPAWPDSSSDSGLELVVLLTATVIAFYKPWGLVGRATRSMRNFIAAVTALVVGFVSIDIHEIPVV